MAAPQQPPAVAVDVLVEAGDWPPASDLRALAARAISAAAGKAEVRLAHNPEVSLLFTDDRRIRTLNRKYRKRDAPTNVLSFPAAGSGEPYGPLLGDIVLARETIDREIAASGLALDSHLNHLIVHGFLHLLGFGHADDRQAAVMEAAEAAILADLGVADPHAEASPSEP